MQVTPELAKQLFNAILQIPELNLNKPETGCFIRAKLIAEFLKGQGVNPKIVLVKNPGIMGKIFYKLNGKIEHKMVNWKYHVAAGTEINGETIVFDPVLFNAPETLKYWASRMLIGEKSISDDYVLVNDYEPIGKNFISKEIERLSAQNHQEWFEKSENPECELVVPNSFWSRKFGRE